MLSRLGVQPQKERLFIHSKGNKGLAGVAQTWMRIGDRQEMAMVVFAEEHKPPVLGHVTLSEFSMAVTSDGKGLEEVPARMSSPRVVI